MLGYLVAALVVVVAAVIAFGIAALLHMQGLTYILFVALILIIGIGAAVLIIVMHLRAKKQSTLEGEGAPSESKLELDLLLNDANRKLRDSQQGVKTLESLPLIYILGDTGSAKTTTVLQSGLEPELLAGSVSQASTQTPTPILNLWYTRMAALLEIGDAVRHSNPLLGRLIHRTRASAYRSAFGAGAPPRAIIVCLSAEQLLQTAGGDSLLASARATGKQLREISRILGMPVAVYVIVTKLDRVPYFDEYVRNLSDDEVRQALGATLGRIDSSAGTYADQASRTLSASIDALVFKLGGFRIEVLDRENDPANISHVYEFPREFGKLQKNLNQYLVELCKPSQLSANPYLRGYYFTGVRARILERAVAAPVMAEAAVAKDAGATQYLNLSALRAKAADQPATPVVTSSRVPQWTFLPRLLPEVILSDKSALSPTRQSASARLFRRILFGTLGFIFALATSLVLVSYFNNEALERRIREDAQGLPTASADSIVSPTLTQLQKLDDLRQVIVLLDDQQKNGIPLLDRIGLYQGDHLRESARRIYFDRFRPFILNQIQDGLVQHMRRLPDAAQGNSNDMTMYLAAYNPLKAYLITTNRPEKSQPAFQTPILVQYWNGAGQADPSQLPLAQKQIDFYGEELLRHPPYSIDPDSVVVKHTQTYLNTFLAAARIYKSMLDDADKKSAQGIDFGKQYPNPFVTDSHVIRGAFTREGYSFMQEALQHPERYANGEKWVLGDQIGTDLDASALAKELSAQYSAEYLKEWHQFLVSAHVSPCGGLKEAPKELAALSGPSSPLLELFYVVSHNTAVAGQQIKSTFQPAQILVDPNATDRFVGPGNSDYVKALTNLGLNLDPLVQSPSFATDPSAFQQIAPSIVAAKGAVAQASQAFNIDKDTHTEKLVTDLMNQPIDCLSRYQPSPGAAANGAGGNICSAINLLRGKFPFSNSSQAQASLSEVDNVFAPDTGVLWVNYNGVLKQYLVPAGGQSNASYVQAPNAPQPPSPGFIAYFNHAAHISNTLYAPGQKTPSFTFNLRFLPGNGVKSATLVVDGQRIPSGATSQQFTWNGKTAQSTSLLYDNKEAISFQGPWSVFQMIRTAAPHITRSGSGYKLEYPIDTSTTIAGHKIGGNSGAPNIVTFELSGPGADLLVGDGFAVPACVKAVAK